MMDPCSKPYFFTQVDQESFARSSKLMTYIQLIADKGLSEEHSLLVKIITEAVINEKARIIRVLSTQNGFFLKKRDLNFATVNHMVLCAFKIKSLEFVISQNLKNFFLYELNFEKIKEVKNFEPHLGCLIKIQSISEIIDGLESNFNVDRIEMFKSMIKIFTEQKMELDEEGNTPLHRAVLEGDIDKIRQLLLLGTDLRVQNNDEFTALDYLFDEFLTYKNSQKFEEILELFLENCQAKDLINQKICGPALQNAFKNGHIVCARAILRNFPICKLDIQVKDKKNGSSTTYPWYAQYVNDAFSTSASKELLNLLIEQGADLNKLIVDYTDSSPIKFKHKEFFLNFNHHLSLFSHEQKQELIDGPLTYFLENGVNPNFKDSEGNTPLMKCIMDKEIESDLMKGIVRIFLQYGADVNTKNNEGKTPLHYAVKNDDIDLVKFLVENKALINQKDSIGYIPLFYTSCPEMVEYLFSVGSDMNTRDILGNTFLHYSVQEDEKVNLVHYLLDHKDRLKINLNMQNVRGMTPLHYAACGHPALTELLLDYKADKTLEDKEGKNPYEFSKFVADEMMLVIPTSLKSAFNAAQSYLS